MNQKPLTHNELIRAKESLGKIIALMGCQAKVEAFQDGPEEILLHVESPDAGILIGRDAQVLNAIQYILNRILYHRNDDARHCIVDIERYRERKRDRLLKTAFEAMDQVRRRGRPYRLPPMNSHDRRIIHQALGDQDDIRTFSEEGEKPGLKRVVVTPAED